MLFKNLITDDITNAEFFEIMSQKEKAVLLVGPGLGGLGGVANYYITILPLLKENKEYMILYLETGSAKGRGNPFYPISDQFNFHNCIKNTKPVMIHINPSLDPKSFIRDGILIYQAVRRKIPVVVFFRGWDVDFAQQVEKYLLRFFRATYGRADSFIVLASEFKEKLRAWNVRVPIYIETTTVDPALLENFDIKAKSKSIQNNQTVKILFLSRIEVAKGVFETVDAVQMLLKKNFQVSLSIAGDGPARIQLETYVRKLCLPPGRINFLGYVRGEQKASVFAEHDIYCFPTYYREGLPNAVLEALAFGMPVITCAVGGLTDIFKDNEMGSLVPKRDTQAVADSIEKLICDRKSMARMAQYNHTYAKENFLAPKVAKRLLKIYQQTIQSKKNAK